MKPTPEQIAFDKWYAQERPPHNGWLSAAFASGYAAGAAQQRETDAELAEAYLHITPSEGGDDLDRIGRYSNGTVMRIAAAIRAQQEAKG
jgi:hypothetical protein